MASERGSGQWPVLEKQNGLERPAKEGDSPVRERDAVPFGNIPSNACHGKTGVNLCGPSHKAKYSSETDSELSSASER